MVRGLYVPLVTPFAEDGSADVLALERLADDILAGGARGIAVLATTGEAHALSDDERRGVVATCADVARAHGADLLVGAGTNDTAATIARHEALADVPGVTASLTVVPYYVRPSEAAIVEHFRLVAERSPVPLVLYNIPYRTGRGLGAPALLELAATDGVIGVKQAVGGIDADTLVLLRDAPPGFAVLSGDDAFILQLILMGGHGAIAASGHLCTERFVAMIERGLAGDAAAARAHADALLPLVLALFDEPSPAVLKGVLHAEGRIPTPRLRMPLAEASDAGTEAALAALRAQPPFDAGT